MVGPYTAATLGAWTCDRAAEGYTFTFAPSKLDGYWSQRPVTRIEVVLGTATWTWDVAGFDVSAGSVSLPSAPVRR